MKTFIPAQQYVKTLGRTFFCNDQLFLALSGTGIEFTMTGTKAEITLTGDHIATLLANTDNYARIAIYVDDVRVVDAMIDEREKTYSIFESDEAKTVTIRVIKLSESAMSTIGIKQITVEAANDIKPVGARKHRIEFIGDSITCGYGVDDEVIEHSFKTSTEDVTKTYAFKTAQALNADYSMVSFSGYGVISGFSYDGETKVLDQLVPNYYEKMGHSNGKFDDNYQVDAILWNFSKFKPELIVINLGTNDDSYCGTYRERQEEFKHQYKEFLKVIRKNNPNATILCTLGIMGDRLYKSVEEAVSDYSKQTGDLNLSLMRFTLQSESDGYAVDWHPTEATHTKAADKLIQTIKQLMNW